MGIQINGNTDNISATDGGLTVSDLELNQTGVSTFHSHLHVADQIIHLDDANSKIRFPAADTITAETAGTERLRITSTGEVKIMNTSGTVGLYFQSSSGAVSNFRAIGTNNQSLGYFFGNTEKIRFSSDGKLGVGIAAPTKLLDIATATSADGIRVKSTGNTYNELSFDANRTSAGSHIGRIISHWNGTAVSYISMDAGSDTTNKDDGMIRFWAAADGNGNYERFRIGSSGQLGIAGANYGSSGQVLTSQGSGSAPQWATPSSDLVNDTSPQLGGNLDSNGNNIKLGDSSSSNDDRLQIGAATFGDLELYHDGTNSYIDNATNDLFIRNTGDDIIIQAADNITLAVQGGENGIAIAGNGGVQIYHDNSLKFETYSDGVITNGHILPYPTNTYDLGATSYRWRNIYTNDLNLSNKGSTNCVDNTWGDYTIQEGENDLFLINNRNGKKYKFNLTEVS